MIPHILRGLLALGLLVVTAHCSDDDDSPTGGTGAGGVGSGGVVASPGGSGGSGGAGRAGSGGSGAAGSGGVGATGGKGGSSAGGTGGSAGASTSEGESDAGVRVCDAQCAAGEHCELMEVTCVRAPCPPQPTCVADSANGASCGSRGLDACTGNQFCEFTAGSGCGANDSGGTCKARPKFCTEQHEPVCGCDGMTYDNACKAQTAGVSVDTTGECSGR